MKPQFIFFQGVLILILFQTSLDTNAQDIKPQILKIGKHIWMTHNLDVAVFRNGDTIYNATSQEDWIRALKRQQPAWCYFDNDSVNGEIYGKIYNWYAVIDSRRLAPQGFHISTEAEWREMINFLGGEKSAGAKLKNNSGWKYENNGTNSSGFTALPGGSFFYLTGAFTRQGFGAYWWLASNSNQNGSNYVSLDSDAYIWFGGDTENGYYVRCVKD